jgi:hypothetical protein
LIFQPTHQSKYLRATRAVSAVRFRPWAPFDISADSNLT